MDFCQKCQHPKGEEDGKVYIIIDDDLGVRPQPCMLCTHNKTNEPIKEDKSGSTDNKNSEEEKAYKEC